MPSLNEAIARHIEPDFVFDESLDRSTLQRICSRIYSPKGCWEWCGTVKWAPRDFDSDPACTVMLLEKLQEYDAAHSPDERMLDIVIYQKPLQRAVAKAYAEAFGLDYED